MQNKNYMFDCPVHGTETTIHCFRAFDEQYVDRWSTYKIETTGKVNEADARKHIRSMNEGALNNLTNPCGLLALPEQDT